MAFIDCVGRAVDGGEMDEEFAQRVIESYKRIKKRLEAAGDVNAEAKAAQSAAAEAQARASDSARVKFLQARAQKKLFDDIANYRAVGEQIKPAEAGGAVFDSTGLSAVPGVMQIRDEIRAQVHSMLDGLLYSQRKGVLGNTRDEASLLRIGREIFGETTGDGLAREMANAWKQASAFLRQKYNEAGGRIQFRSDWGLPQTHDWVAIRGATREAWKSFVIERLDLRRMAYGRTEPTREAVLEQLDEIYEALSTNGANDIDLDTAMLQKAQHNKRAESRYLAFKDFDSWLEYQQQFGSGDIFAIMNDHIDGMSRDIAAMTRLGPNPNMGVEAVQAAVQKQTLEIGSLDNYKARIQEIWDAYTGVSNMPENAAVAKLMSNTRATLTASQLGSAVISAISDVGFTAMTAHFNGMKPTRVMKRAISLTKDSERMRAVRAGFIAETWSDAVAMQARYHDDTLSSPFFQKMVGGVLKASGLNFWTDTWRWAFQMEMLSLLTENVGKSFDALPADLSKALTRYKITPEDWDIIRKTELYDEGEGVTFLRTQDIMRRKDINQRMAEDLGFKVSNFIQNETNFAVPTGSLRGKALAGRLPKAGTALGELSRSALMYKNFPITLYLTHIRRALDEVAEGRKGYAATLLIVPTLMGALALQMKGLKDGKEPADMSKPGFWMRAMVQGGGLGIFGDFVLADQTRYGHNPFESLGGPVVGALGDAGRVVQGLTIDAYISGDFGKEFAKATGIASNYVPGRSLWYIAALYKRAFQDNLRAMGDKRPARRFDRMIKRREKLEGAGYWWEPGEVNPFD